MVVDFNEISKEDVMIAGGKGANLGEMVSAGINVPKGFIVTADAYRDFLETNGLYKLFERELLRVENNEAELLKTVEGFRKIISISKMPYYTGDEIKRAYDKLGENARVAVRSSATAEDLPEASFAGQQETYLNVRGAYEVIGKVIDCYSSLWGNRAVSYRANQGYNQLSVNIAVVVQEMVESEKAGVLFTVNPINGNVNEMQINASYGLGESVVSGRVTADSYIVDKSGKIVDMSIGSKKTQIIYAEKDTKEVEVSKELREQAALNAEEIAGLVKAGKAIEEHYGRPMDIEWAIRGTEVYILQARAITTLKENYDDELVKSYLKNSKISKMMKRQMAFQLEKMPFAYRALDYDYMITINNQKAVIFDEAGIKLNSNPQIDDDGIQTLPKEVKGINRRIFRLFKMIKMLKNYEYCADKCKIFMEKYDKEIAGLKEKDFTQMNLSECGRFLEYSRDLLKNLSYDRFKYALFPSALNKDLEKILKKVGTGHTVFDLYRNLDNKTAVVTRDVERLADEIKKNDRLKKAIIGGENFESICKNFPDFNNLSKEFFVKDGFKSDYNCYCIDSKTFIEDPDRLISIIKPLIIQEDDIKEDAEDFVRLMADIERVAGGEYAEIKKRIEYFRYFHIVREESQYLWETLFYYVRKCITRINFLLLGEEDYKAGVANLFYKELIETLNRGYLNYDDLEKIKRRKKEYPLAVKVWEASKILVFDTDGDILSGTSGSRGVAVGSACIIKEPAEFYKMRKGDILICHLTDPEWTPLFRLAGAVVSDTGSALSHAAIVAREYSIPAVLGVGVATSKFKDGDRIKVDGDKGQVSKVS